MNMKKTHSALFRLLMTVIAAVMLLSSCDAYVAELSELPAITAFSEDQLTAGTETAASDTGMPDADNETETAEPTSSPETESSDTESAVTETAVAKTEAPGTEAPETAAPDTAAAETEPAPAGGIIQGTVNWIDADHFEIISDQRVPLAIPLDDRVTAPEYGVMYGAAVKVNVNENGGIISAEVGGLPLADQAYTIMRDMSDEERVGQLIMAGCSDRSTALSAVENYHLGGLVLFARDFKNDTVASETAANQAYQDRAKIPLIISADEEGGTVCRVSYYTQYRSSYFLSPRAMYARAGMDGIRSEAAEKAKLLLSLGVNMNLAPVADISTDPNDFIYERSLGQSPEITGEFIKTVVGVNREEGIASCLKHFPGYGSASDTHTGIAYDGRSLDDFITKDFVPFKAGIDSGAGAVMVAHIICSGIDPDAPACLSKETHKLLRQNLGFTGVCVTDDLGMGAITQYTGGYNAAVTAILAGNDILAVAGDYITPYKAVLESVQNGTIPRHMLDGACMRVLMYKLDNGIIAG